MNDSSQRKKIICSITLVLFVGLVVVACWAYPRFMKARRVAQCNACVSNMRLLDSCKEQWAYQNDIPDGSPCDTNAVLQYGKGATMPWCPTTGGPTYSLGKMGEDPSCPVHGSLMNPHYPDGTSIWEQ